MNQGRWLALLPLVLTVACSKPANDARKLGAVPIPAPQKVAAWCIDEVNGSDSNPGTTAGNCFKTVHHLTDEIWGCWGQPAGCPRLLQNTTVTFYNAGDATAADPIVLFPSLENGKWLALTGVPYGCIADTLRAVSAGGGATRTGMQLATLNNLDAGAAGMFLGETTVDAGVNSLSWGIASSNAGSIWMWTQPLARTTVPVILNVMPNEQTNTWANSDPVSYCSLPQAALFKVAPLIEHAGANSGSGIYISNLNIVSEAPTSDAGAAQAPLNINSDVHLFENYVGRPVFVAGNADAPGAQYFVNNYFASNVYVQGSSQTTWIVGGTSVGNIVGANIVLDGDTYLQGSANYLASAAGANSNAALAGFADAAVLNMAGPMGQLAVTNGYDAGVLWANGTGGVVNGVGAGRSVYPAGQYNAPQKLVGVVLKLNGQQKACLSYPANAATTQVCNIALSASALSGQLDDAGITGCLTAGQGGAAFCNGNL